MKRVDETTFTVAVVAAWTMGFWPLWALLGTFGGNWQIRGQISQIPSKFGV